MRRWKVSFLTLNLYVGGNALVYIYLLNCDFDWVVLGWGEILSKNKIFCCFRCIPEYLKCNGQNDCSRGEDERGCRGTVHKICSVQCSYLIGVKWMNLANKLFSFLCNVCTLFTCHVPLMNWNGSYLQARSVSVCGWIPMPSPR